MNALIKKLLGSIVAGLCVLGSPLARAQASGGTVTTSGGYTVHTFTSSGTFTVSSGITADIVIVGGGGGGGAQHAAGGGAGGIVVLSSQSLSPGSYSISLGAGGNGCPSYGTYSGWSGQNGGNTTAFGQTAYGGGGGGGTNGSNGGCGGGANASAVNGFQGSPGTGSQGYNGSANTSNSLAGGAGGGLGGAASLSTGGAPVTNWAGTFGGGGGGGYVGGPGGGAGAGAGGSGAAAGGSASANTGSGGGGGGNFSAVGGAGGSGIVVIRYGVTVNRTLTVSAPATAYAGQTVSFPSSASTNGPGGEQLGFYHIDYSTNGGASWTPYAYDVDQGTSASRTVSFTAGAAGTTAMVRAKVAYRYGTAGDVDYTGAAINWGGSWGSWSTPPAKYASILVAPAETVIGTAGSSGVYHLKGSIVKAANPSDSTDFGDGVVLEVFKRSGSTETPLWSSLLARPNSANPAKLNLTVSLATGDTLRYRLVSPTSDTNYDTLDGATSFTMKSAAVVTYNSISPSANTSDNKADDIQALINTAAAEMNNPSTTYDRAEIVLPSGTYYLQDYSGAHGEALLSFGSTKNITLRGAGAKLVINAVTPKMFLTVDSSTNIEVGDLELDYTDAYAPFIQGTVSAVSGSTATVNLSWAPQGTSRFASGLFCFKFQQSAPELLAGGFDISSCSISGSTATLTVSSGSLAVGDPVALAIRGNVDGEPIRLQESALRVNGSTDCTLRDLTLRAGGWIAFIGKDNNGLHFDRYKVLPGTGRFISTNGDGIQLKGSRRGPSVDGCQFKGMLDDGINLHAPIYPISSVTTTTFVSSGGSVAVGDIVQVFQWDSGNVGQALGYQLHKVTGVSGSTVTVTGSISSGSNRYVNVSASGEGFLIRHSTFERFRNRGLLIQTGYGLIDDNDFLETSGFGISFESNLGRNDFQEGPFPHHTSVTNNYFYKTGYSGQPAIQIWGHNLSNPPAPMFQALAAAILGNTFVNQTSSPVAIYTGTETFNSGANSITP